MKRTRKKTKKTLPILLPILIIALIALILIFASAFNGSYSPTIYCPLEYKMELYIKTPSGVETKIRECTSSTPEFECTQAYNLCPETGNYYSRALTYFQGSLISDSSWRLAYQC